jgi:hypothetical protein
VRSPADESVRTEKTTCIELVVLVDSAEKVSPSTSPLSRILGFYEISSSSSLPKLVSAPLLPLTDADQVDEMPATIGDLA